MEPAIDGNHQDRNHQSDERKMKSLRRKPVIIFEALFEKFLCHQNGISFLSFESVSNSVDIVLKVLQQEPDDDMQEPVVCGKACYCLSLIARIRLDGALDVVDKGGVGCILNVMKAFPKNEVLQVGCLVTISQLASQISDREDYFLPVVESVVKAMEELSESSEVFEAACLVIMSLSLIFGRKPLDHELIIGYIVYGLHVHGYDDKAHFAGLRAIEYLISDPALAKHIVEQAELEQNPGAAA